MQTEAVATVQVKKLVKGEAIDVEDSLAIEEPLQIEMAYYHGADFLQKNISVTMRTPGNDKEIAAGFLFTEGIIKNLAEIDVIKQDDFERNRVVVVLNKNAKPTLANTERNFYTSSSCGVCGKASIDAIKTVSVYHNQNDDIQLGASLFYTLADETKKQQAVFETTGGLHASALFDLHGRFIMLREDVGRHNALDKLIGMALLDNKLPLDHVILLLSGRASFELIQKAAMAGIRIIAAVGAPSSLAVSLAKESGITLLGFLRNERFNIYAGEWRIKL